MAFLKNTISLLAVFSVIPAALAVTARPSILNTANVSGVSANGVARRMPTLTTYLASGLVSSSSSSSSASSSALYEDTECIDAYTSCIKGADACGPDFSECTTNVLFHAQMPDCISTLYQCSTSGINSLFGVGAVDALSSVATTNEHDEVTRYTYPTDGSVMGQMITAAAIANKYDMPTCVKRYSSCLRKESVCGEDFELCTTNAEFRKQSVLCDSTLARCQADAVTELFGSSSGKSAPAATSRIGEMITEGAALAAVNAVSTCYKVVDQCILNACAANPYKCFEGATAETVDLADAVEGGKAATATADATQVISKSNISAYISNSCRDTIGSNKYCYATFLGNGVMPTASQLRDEDNQEDVYAEAYGARMNSGMKAKITELVEKFDTKAKDKCSQTIMACAQRTCGGGSGAACYTEVFGGTDKSINNETSREDIKTGCAAIVNTDPNCQYAATNPTSTGTYNYSYVKGDAFDTLFPVYDDGAESDPIGVVAALNASLATNYNDAAIANMKQQCRTLATSCVKSMCGADYVNCYRNRTDIYSSLTNTGAEDFDKSMNKVGGVLDYTIVLGLCVDTIQNASVCQEHLAIEKNKIANNLMKDKGAVSSWGNKTNVRSGWYDAGSATKMDVDEGVQATDSNGNLLCAASSGAQGICNTMTEDGDIFSEPVMLTFTTYAQSQAANTLFKDLIYDLEKEAQAKYNAKLTKQQNDCMAQNSIGGIMGKNDIGSTFMWARLKGNKVPADYQSMGLKANQFVASNELYGSFCRVRVTLHSDDPDIMSALNGNLVKKSVDSNDFSVDKSAGFKIESAGLGNKDWNTAYFAVGDSFVCGSWIPQEDLLNIANVVGQNARADKQMSQPQLKGWMTALGAIGLGTGGAFLGDAIQDGSVFSGLSNKTKPKKASEVKKLQENCEDYFNKAMDNVLSQIAKEKTTSEYADLCDSNARKGYNLLQKNDKDDSKKWQAYTDALGVYSTAKTSTTDSAPKNVASEAKALRDAITELQGLCSSIDDGGEESKLKGLGAGIGAGVGAIGGGLLGYYITDSIQKAQLDSAQQQAINEFMENIGSKIKCYIGPDEVGTYGEVVPTSME